MSESQAASGQATQTESSVDPKQASQTENSSGVVSYDTHRKLLAEKKQMQAKYEDMAKRLEQIESDKMVQEGKKDELLKKYESKVKDLESTLKQKDAGFAKTLITEQLKSEAVNRGALDVDWFVDAISRKLETLDQDALENYKIKSDELKRLADEVQKEKQVLFKKPQVNVQVGLPSSVQTGVDWTKLSFKEKAKLALEKSRASGRKN